MDTSTAKVERHDFGAEVGRLLHLVVHSLYSDRQIFLRELVANAADATDRRRFETLTDPRLATTAEAKIRIVPDREARTLLIADDGIGMSREELAEHLGTIARSGTLAFSEKLTNARPEDRPNLIGQFGVGFYSAFMVAERVAVTSRRAGAEEAWLWESDGGGEFTLAPAERETPGTDVLLHIKPDADEFLDPIRLETIIRRWADHITVPITLHRDGKDLAANEGTALWRKPKAEISEQSYNEFYRHLGHLFDTPWATLHWRGEGTIEFSALLFVPGSRPFAVAETERESHVRLHVRRMFITDQAKLLPPWLRFVQGVVDTEDLPLNVSREMLQATPVLARIRKALIGRVLGELKTRARDAADFATFWDYFGSVVKEALWDDAEYRAEVAAVVRFRSTHGSEVVSLGEYVSRMSAEQEAIYYLAGDDADALARSPQLEGLRAQGIEALLFTDPIDAFWPERLDEFEGKPIRSVTQATLKPAGSRAEPPADVSALVTALAKALADAVSAVRVTDRLVDSAVVLAAAERGPDLQMQRLLRRSGRAIPAAPPTLEINPRHELIRSLATTVAGGADLGDSPRLLLDLALVQDGELPEDPAAFARRVAGLLSQHLAGSIAPST
jgi:molecular chaperone HtpG